MIEGVAGGVAGTGILVAKGAEEMLRYDRKGHERGGFAGRVADTFALATTYMTSASPAEPEPELEPELEPETEGTAQADAGEPSNMSNARNFFGKFTSGKFTSGWAGESQDDHDSKPAEGVTPLSGRH